MPTLPAPGSGLVTSDLVGVRHVGLLHVNVDRTVCRQVLRAEAHQLTF